MLDYKRKYIYNSTIKTVFNKFYKKYPNNILLSNSVKLNEFSDKSYSFSEVKKHIDRNINFFKKNKFNIGDRVALIIGNNPEYFILKLSLNYFGLSCVPINNELTIREIAFIIKNSNPRYIIYSNANKLLIKKLISVNPIKNVGLINFTLNHLELKTPSLKKYKKKIQKLSSKLESSILYTSGTTGNPKGCILTHEYEINAGYSYAIKKGLISFKIGKERLYNCLPVHHINSGVFSFFAMLMTGNCHIQAKRFSASEFWNDIKQTKATIFHYLGVMVTILFKQNNNSAFNNNLRLGVGAGIEPSLHYKFEKKFKIPMIELWGMTEMVRCIIDNSKKRIIGKRCFGEISYGLESKVVDNKGMQIYNKPGLFFIRFNKKNPKLGFFNGYNKNKAATLDAWKKGWFNTGDIVIKDKSGKHYFVDREKNIIRRSGENISSSEIEQFLLDIKFINNCAVLSKKHEIYEEEVFALIIIKKHIKKNIITGKKIIKELSKELAYFKLPCYIKFVDTLPLTSSQKIDRNKTKNLLLNYKNDHFFDLEKYKRSFKK